MPDLVLPLLFGDEIRGCAVELSQEPNLTDIALVRTFALATELQSRNHLSAQWCHDKPPWLS